MKQKFTRHCVRLLMLFVGLFALSQTADAWYLRGKLPNSAGNLVDLWNPSSQAEAYNMGSSNSYTLPQISPNASDKKIYFKIYSDWTGESEPIFGAYQNDADFTAHTSSNKYGSTGKNQEGKNWGTNSGAFYMTLDPNYQYTIYVVYNNNNNSPYADVYYTSVYKPQSTTPTNPDVYLRGEMNGWSENPSDWKFTYDSSKEYYTLSSVTIPANQKFKVAGAGSWSEASGSINFGRPEGDQVINPSGEVALTHNAKDIILSTTYNGNIIFKYDGDNNSKLLFPDAKTYSGMPFYPKGISTEYAFSQIDPNEEFYYLIGHAINNEKASPEWQMELGKDGKYHIDFTYNRHDHEGWEGNTFKVAAYKKNDASPTIKDENGTKIDDDKKSEFFKTVNKKSYEHAGVRMRATYDKNSNKLTFTYLDVKNQPTSNRDEAAYLPMVAFVGQEWKQAETYNIDVPTSDKYNDWRTTDSGWQNSWIQYGEDGLPVMSRDGSKVYFNTQWPPLNDIIFTTQAGNNTINLSSNDLTFTTKGETGNAAYWKAKGFTGVDFSYDLNADYVMYEVSNLWITGKFKLWSGCSGARTSNEGDGAEWDYHWNWGEYNQYPYWNEQNSPVNVGNKLNNGSGTIHLGVKDGDMIFSNATYYPKVYFFLDLNHPNNDTGDTGNDHAQRHSLLYFEKAYGNANILARGNENHDKGYFLPSIEDLTDNVTVKSFSLSVWRNSDDSKVKDLIGNSGDLSGQNIKNNTAFRNAFQNLGNFELQSDSYRHDGEIYSETGYYYYTLTVVFNTGNNQTKTVTVKSTPFLIINDKVAHRLRAYQLVQLPESDNQYITYNTSGTTRIVNVNNFTNDVVSSVETASTVYTADEIQNIYENTGVWTNKVLCLTTLPTSFDDLPYYETTFNGFSIVGGADNEVPMYGVNSNNYFVTIVNKGSQLNKTTFISKLNATYKVSASSNAVDLGDNIAPQSEINYIPAFVAPGFGNATLSFDDDDSKSGAGSYTASHEDLYTKDGDAKQQAGVETNRHMLQADIEVLMPNIDASIREDVYKELNLIIEANNATYKVNPVSEADKFGLSYKYQNPYDWMYQDDETWKGYVKTWNMVDNHYAPGRIETIQRTLLANGTKVEGYNPQSTSIQAHPRFFEPQLASKSFTYVENALFNDNSFELKLQNAVVNMPASEEETDDFDPGKETNSAFTQDQNTVFLVKLTSNIEGAESVSKVMNYNINGIGSDEVIFKMDAGELTKVNGQHTWRDVTAAMKDLKVEVAYAYYFSAGGQADYSGTGDAEIFDAAVPSSGWVNFTSEDGFPYMREDHKASDKQNVRRRAANEDNSYPETSEGIDASKVLMSGDNAYLLAPVYAVLKESYAPDADDSVLEDTGLPTGVEGVEIDGASILSGRGFIDLNGNEGVIFAADGTKVYAGNSRADLVQGVYVVTYGTRSVKVLVK